MVRLAANQSPAVSQCQAEGRTQRQTAEKLGMSLACVQTHWTRSGQFGRPTKRNAVKLLLAQGNTDKQISQELHISVSTVNRQRNATRLLGRK